MPLLQFGVMGPVIFKPVTGVLAVDALFRTGQVSLPVAGLVTCMFPHLTHDSASADKATRVMQTQ